MRFCIGINTQNIAVGDKVKIGNGKTVWEVEKVMGKVWVTNGKIHKSAHFSQVIKVA